MNNSYATFILFIHFFKQNLYIINTILADNKNQFLFKQINYFIQNSGVYNRYNFLKDTLVDFFHF